MSADAESNGHRSGTAVLERVKHALAEAAANGEPEPGRDALAQQLGVKPHVVRKAKEVLALEATRVAPAGASSPAEDAETPAPDSVRPGATPPAGGDPDPVPASSSASLAPVPQAGAKLVAWVGFAFGSVMSIAANILHTWLPAEHAPPGWAPGLAPQIGAAVWPIGLLLSVEVLSRVSWRQGWLWGLARYGGAGTVAIGSGVISYGHLREVLVAWGYGHPGADVGPLVLDGLMVVCGFALLSMTTRQAGRQQ